MSEQQPQPQEQVRIRKKRYRKKKRWPKVLLWTLSIVVVLGVGGLFAANYAIDKFLEQMVAEIDMGEIVADTGGTDKPNGGTETAGGGGEGEEIVGNEIVIPTNQNSEVPTGVNKENEDLDGYSAEVTTDKAKHVQESVTLGDKSRVLSIIMSQLSMDDIKRLQELASGGLTLDEKKEARNLILEKFSPDEYNELIEIAHRYGLSEGNSYDEVIKYKE